MKYLFTLPLAVSAFLEQRGNHEIFIHPSIGRLGFSCRLRF